MGRLIILLLLLCLPVSAFSLDVPPLRGHVNDYAGLISQEKVSALEDSLSRFEKDESSQLVILTLPSLAGENLETFSIRVAESWKIGQKGVDNGALLVIAAQEKKIRIEVGRGLEGKLTDLVAGRIIRNEITPLFKAGDFAGGISAGVVAMMAVVKGEYRNVAKDIQYGGKSASPIFTLLIFLLVACIALGAFSRLLGCLAGTAGLPLAVWLSFPGLSLVVLSGLATVGFFLGLFLSNLFSSGGPGGYFGGPFGGGFGGGSVGGDDGGYSGGGGDFGGGGASGDW